MNFYALHASGVQATIDLFADTCPVVTWVGVDRKVIPNSIIRRKDLAQGGFQMDADLRFETMVASWIDDPNDSIRTVKNRMLQSPLGYLGEVYKIITVTVRPGELHMMVDCNSIDQQA